MLPTYGSVSMPRRHSVAASLAPTWEMRKIASAPVQDRRVKSRRHARIAVTSLLRGSSWGYENVSRVLSVNVSQNKR
jgi:hypothetical protein